MNRLTLWQVQGLGPTADRAAIRRAYAGQLPVARRGDDPEAFQLLRAAYETALALCALMFRVLPLILLRAELVS